MSLLKVLRPYSTNCVQSKLCALWSLGVIIICVGLCHQAYVLWGSLVSVCFSILGIASFLTCFCFILNTCHLPQPSNQHYITNYNQISFAFICIPLPSFLPPFLFLFYFFIESFCRSRQVCILRHILFLFSYTNLAYHIYCTLPCFFFYSVLKIMCIRVILYRHP